MRRRIVILASLVGLALLLGLLLPTPTFMAGESQPLTPQTNTLAPCLGSLYGRVIDCDTLKPLKDVAIYVDGTLKATTSGAGNYYIGGLAAGTRTVQAVKAGYLECQQSVVVKSCQTSLLGFSLRCQAEVTVLVKDNVSGIAVQDATVSVEYTLCCGSRPAPATATTNALGKAKLIVPQGTWTFKVTKAGYLAGEFKNIVVVCGPNDLTATPFGLWPCPRVNGKVTENGKPYAGATVKLIKVAATPSEQKYTTGANGRYGFPCAEPGTYKVRIVIGGVAKCESPAFVIQQGNTEWNLNREVIGCVWQINHWP